MVLLLLLLLLAVAAAAAAVLVVVVVELWVVQRRPDITVSKDNTVVAKNVCAVMALRSV